MLLVRANSVFGDEDRNQIKSRLQEIICYGSKLKEQHEQRFKDQNYNQIRALKLKSRQNQCTNGPVERGFVVPLDLLCSEVTALPPPAASGGSEPALRGRCTWKPRLH